MRYVDTAGNLKMSVEITDVPDLLHGMGELLFMAQGGDISIEDRTLVLLDYICENIAHDVASDLKERGIEG